MDDAALAAQEDSMLSKTLMATTLTSVLAVPVAFADDTNPSDANPSDETVTPVADEAITPKAACPTAEPACEPAPAPQPTYNTQPQYSPPAYNSTVYADEVEVQGPDKYSYEWYDPRLTTGIGVGVQIGAGIGGFTDSTVNDLSSSEIGGVWQFRTTIGTHTPLGLDVAYNGTAYDLQSVGSLNTGTLIGTNVEGALRWNILPHYEWNPYLFAGAGWQHYDIADNQLSRADDGIGDQDDLAVFPMGAGISYRDTSGITGELRGTFRAAADSSFIQDSSGDNASLHTWEASAGLGYEF
jgi:opacity protein-like surface antigen